MAIHRTSSITDFFKPSAQPQSAKRSAPDNDIELSAARRKSRSNTSKSAQFSTLEQTTGNEQTQGLPSSSVRSVDAVCSSGATRIAHHEANSISHDNSAQKSGDSTAESFSFSSSQGLIIPSSQRIVKNGQVMIRNSDDEDSESDSSLRDIDDMLGSRKAPTEAASSPLTEPGSAVPTPVGSCAIESDNKNTRTTRASTGIRKKPARSRSTSPRVPRYKFDLQSLVKRSRKDEVSEAGMAQAKSVLEDIGRLEETVVEETNKETAHVAAVDPSTITSVVKSHGDGNDADRLMMAIQRTEALQIEKSWSFFDAEDEPSDIAQPPWPHLAPRSWHHMLEEPRCRQQLFLSGFVGDIAINGSLPKEMLLWLIDAVCTEPREDLRYAYSRTLKDAAKDIGSLIEPHRIDMLFGKIGARPEALRVEKSVIPVARTPYKEISIPHRPRLISVLKLLRDLAPYLIVSARSHSVSLLCRLLLDHKTSNDPSISLVIEEAFESLIDSGSDDEMDDESTSFLTTIYNTVLDLSLRSQLIHKLPGTSARLCLLRRRLSLAFFFQDPAYLSKPQGNLVKLSHMSHHLTTGKYIIGRETDFAELGAMVLLLNVGVDCGDPPPAEIDSNGPKRFDEEVDELSYAIKSISNQIKDTGASQMKKTEAKEILEDFNAKLLCAVRTRPKPKLNPFGDAKIKDFFTKD